MSCAPLETVAAYSVGDLSEADEQAFEEHFFACDACLRRVESLRRLLDKLALALPPVLTRARHERLARAVEPLLTVRVLPGERRSLHLGKTQRIGVWVMQAPLAEVATAERVDLEVRSADGTPLFSIPDAPFDRERGEVLMACQAHYANLGLPADLHVELRRVDAGSARRVADYVLDHVYDSL